MERAKTLPAAGELESLKSFLDFQRATMVEKAEGITDEQGASKPVEPSTLSLSGLIKHLALVEESWFQSVFAGGDLGEPWSSAPFDDDDDWEFNSASGDRISELIDMYEVACEKSRQVVAGADSLDQLSAKDTHRGRVSFALDPSAYDRGDGSSRRPRRPDPGANRRDHGDLNPDGVAARGSS